MRPIRIDPRVAKERMAAALPAKRTAGRWIQDRETGRLIEETVWLQMNSNRPKGRSAAVWRDYPEFQSPVDGKVVRGRRQHRYDLQRTGSRQYEGFEQEEKEANKFRREQEKAYEQSLEKTLWETKRELEWKEIKAEDHIQSQWLLGED